MRRVVVKSPGIPQYFSTFTTHVDRAARANPSTAMGACGGGEHNSRFTVTPAARSHACASVAGGFRIDGAFGSDVPSIRVGARHRSTRNSCWKPGRRVPPSYPRFRAGTRSSRRGRATSSCARGAPRAARRSQAAWPFTIAPSGISPCSTYRHSAISSFRASATIPMRRCRRLPRPNLSSYQRVSALVG
jgi:hypothetical protein